MMADMFKKARRFVYTALMTPPNIIWYYLFHKKFTPDPPQRELWEHRMERDHKNVVETESNPYYRKLDDYIISRIKDYNAGTYLEIGCYFGYRLNKFAGEIPGSKFIGLELGLDNLEFGRNKVITGSNISLINADAARIPFRDNSVDTVYSVVCLSHINYAMIDTVIKEIARVSSKRIILVEINTIPMRLRKKMEVLNAGYIYLHDYRKLMSDRMKLVAVNPIYDFDAHPRYTVFEFAKI